MDNQLKDVNSMLVDLNEAMKARNSRLSQEATAENVDASQKVEKKPTFTVADVLLFILGTAAFGTLIMLGWNFVLVDSVSTFSKISFFDGAALYLLLQIVWATLPPKA